MRFMMLVRGPEGMQPDAELYAAIGRLTEEMQRTGTLLDMGGLTPTSQGARIRISKKKLSITDGPFTEAKEVIGGYAVLNADSRDAAIELGRRFMQLHADILGPEWELELEIRQMEEG